MMPDIKVMPGDTLPDLELEVFPGPGKMRLSSMKGKWLVLYFYPRDDTPGCTKEACNFRDSSREIASMGANVVGVSTDDLKSHGRFYSKYSLNFPLLSDPEGELGRRLGVLKEDTARPSMRRVTFLVDPNGIVRKVYPRVDPTHHSEEIINDLQSMKT